MQERPSENYLMLNNSQGDSQGQLGALGFKYHISGGTVNGHTDTTSPSGPPRLLIRKYVKLNFLYFGHFNMPRKTSTTSGPEGRPRPPRPDHATEAAPLLLL